MRSARKFGTYMLILCALGLAVGAALRPGPVAATAAEDKTDIWTEKSGGAGQIVQLTDLRIEQILTQLGKQDPKRAEELKQLRKDNPKQFRTKMVQAAHELALKAASAPAGAKKPEGSAPGAKGPAGAGRWREHIQKRHEEMLLWLEENYPEEAKKLTALREKNPEMYTRRFNAARQVYDPIRTAQENNPELAEVLKADLELLRHRDELLKSLEKAPEAKRKKLRMQLAEVVADRFDLIIHKKQLRYDELSSRIEEMQKKVRAQRAELNTLKQGKNKAIEARIAELTGQSEKITWK
ncbi:MAG: hypothetical protein KAT00_11230 [Planctomycetes bacterium]|nr:hypothetical protein [Planctomycetota bacterium]